MSKYAEKISPPKHSERNNIHPEKLFYFHLSDSGQLNIYSPDLGKHHEP